jgi:S-adenosylmethionine uptake transporter
VRRVTHPVQGFLAALGAVAVLSAMDAVMKHLVLAIGIFAVSIWRAVSNLLLSTALYLPGRRKWPARRTIWIHICRSVVVTVMAVLFFWGIGRVPLAEGIALTFIAPLIAMLLAPLFLNEVLSGRSLAGAVGAFAGVVVIVIGQARSEVAGDVLFGIAAILASAVCYSVNILMMRWQALAAKPLEINFFQGLVVMALWVAAMPLVGVPDWPRGQFTFVVIASILSTAGGLLFAWAYARGEASYLAVTEYSAFIWASLFGWLVFRERVSFFTLAGAALIVGGCLVAARRKRPPLPEIDVAA